MDQIDVAYFFKTKAQANDFSSRLAALSEKLYVTGFEIENALLEAFGVQKRDKFIILMREQKVQTEKLSEVKDFLQAIQKQITSLPVLSLTLAFEPNAQTLNALSEWFLLNMKQQYLFNISVDPSLIAGTLISVHGQYRDFSLKQPFAKLMQEVLSPVAQPQPAQTTVSNGTVTAQIAATP